jgi:hypothetical protein
MKRIGGSAQPRRHALGALRGTRAPIRPGCQLHRALPSGAVQSRGAVQRKASSARPQRSAEAGWDPDAPV